MTFLVGTGLRHPNAPRGRTWKLLEGSGMRGRLIPAAMRRRAVNQERRFRPQAEPPSMR